MSKFKVGDRVRFKAEFEEYTEGQIAEVAWTGLMGEVALRGDPDIWSEDRLDLRSELVAGNGSESRDITTLTRRDQFAMAALTGLLSGHMAAEEGVTYADRVSNGAYEIADAMEAARNREGAE